MARIRFVRVRDQDPAHFRGIAQSDYRLLHPENLRGKKYKNKNKNI